MNVGADAQITVSVDTGGVALPLTFAVCETTGGTCAPAPSVTLSIPAGATPTFSIFATASGAVPLDPAARRAFVRFRGPGNVVRGATGVAVTTEP